MPDALCDSLTNIGHSTDGLKENYGVIFPYIVDFNPQWMELVWCLDLFKSGYGGCQIFHIP